MKLLQVCKKIPIPPIDGETLAIHQLSKQFQKNKIELSVFAIETQKHPKSKNIENYELKNVNYFFERLDTSISMLEIIKGLFCKTPYIIQRFYHKKVENRLIEILKENTFDIIQLEGLFLATYVKRIRENSEAKIILRSHNVEHKIWARLAKNESNFFKKFYLEKIMIPKLINFETSVLKEIDGLVSISETDLSFFNKIGRNIPSIIIPFATKIHNSEFQLNETFQIGFIGDIQWKPNQEGVDWFLSEIFPKIEKEKIRFNIAGRNSNLLKTLNKNIINHGEVENAKEFMLNQSLFIVPLLSGSGMKVKIIEAMSLGKCVLTTSVGAEGIANKEDDCILIADEPKVWVEILNDLNKNPEKVKSIGEKAKNYVKDKFDEDKLGTQLVDFYTSIL